MNQVYGIEYYDDYVESWDMMDEGHFFSSQDSCLAEIARLNKINWETQLSAYLKNKQYYEERLEKYKNPCAVCGHPKAPPAGREPQMPMYKETYRLVTITLR